MTDEKQNKSVTEIMVEAIMKHADLSEFDKEPIYAEVHAIRGALKNNGYTIEPIEK